MYADSHYKMDGFQSDGTANVPIDPGFSGLYSNTDTPSYTYEKSDAETADWTFHYTDELTVGYDVTDYDYDYTLTLHFHFTKAEGGTFTGTIQTIKSYPPGKKKASVTTIYTRGGQFQFQ